MSTRSGKRLHRSTHDHVEIIEVDGQNQRSLRKTRRRRSKENCDGLDIHLSKFKKRSNYVTYPTDDELTNNIVQEEKAHSPNKILKDYNDRLLLPTGELFGSGDKTKKVRRVTRRTKKFIELHEMCNLSDKIDVIQPVKDDAWKKTRNVSVHQNEEPDAVQKPTLNKNKKSKKKKNVKKTKLSESQNNLSSNNSNNKLHNSVDSFYSAAGSLSDEIKENTHVDCFVKSPLLLNKNQTLISDLVNERSDETEINSFISEKEELGNLSLINSTFDIEDNMGNSSKQFGTIFDLKTINKVNDGNKEGQETMTNCKNEATTKNDFLLANMLNSTLEEATTELRDSVNEKDDDMKIHSIDSDSTDDVKNVTFDMIDIDSSKPNKTTVKRDNINISLNGDNTDTDNILNSSPLLIESSIDETLPLQKPSDEVCNLSSHQTPLKRESTFTKDGPEIIDVTSLNSLSFIKHKIIHKTSHKKTTPEKLISLPSAGGTPFPLSSKSSHKKKVLNVTHSIEKETVPRMTKVMFCSPVDNPVIVAQMKNKVVKSSLKGSNKSFIFNESGSLAVRSTSRKRSFTHNDVEDSLTKKRKRLCDEQQKQSVDRLSKPRTSFASDRVPEPTTPTRRIPRHESKSETKVSCKKMPDFTALHQKQFAKMESLDECQERKAKRAKQLLVPTGSLTVLERTSPKENTIGPPDTKRADRNGLLSKIPTLTSLRPGYTKFGFKMNVENNPFTSSKKEASKSQEKLHASCKSQALPSLAGNTSTRKEVAKRMAMREKSFTSLSGKRDINRKEGRTVIKGVRTNRRFELQMQMRNIN